MSTMSELAALQRERLELFDTTTKLNAKLLKCRLRLAAALILSFEPTANATNSSSCPDVPVVDDSTSLVAERTGKERQHLSDSSDFDHTDEETEGAERMQVDLDVMRKLLGTGKGEFSSHRAHAADGAAEEADDDPADLPAQRPASASSGCRRRSSPELHGAMSVTDDALGTAKNRTSLRWAQVRATTMFLRAFHRSRYPWKQLAGHNGDFLKDENPTWILKRAVEPEEVALTEAMNEATMSKCVVEYKGPMLKGGVRYLMLHNLLVGHVDPNILDLKMGQRTYLTFDTKLDKPRTDLLAKMVKIDPSAPTADEQKVGITKRRYMRFRESRSTTVSHGFRVEACHLSDHLSDVEGPAFSKYTKEGQTEQQTLDLLRQACRLRREIQLKVVANLKLLYIRLSQSDYFAEHEIVGSSILVVIGKLGTVTTTMLDFGKTVRSKHRLSHDISITEIEDRNCQEDGYLVGLKNLTQMFADCMPSEDGSDENCMPSEGGSDKTTPALRKVQSAEARSFSKS